MKGWGWKQFKLVRYVFIYVILDCYFSIYICKILIKYVNYTNVNTYYL
jgi:hypothetical protein